MTYRNPVLPGFYPDPSVCRVGRDYYLVNSSFEYFPGVPVHHSRDLVHWRPMGHCLTRPSQLPLADCRCSGGIYAPTIRHHDGTFYMVTTNVTGGGNFLVTASDPSGPWSEPIWIDQSGIDPSLTFDEDGSVYLTSTVGGGRGIQQSRIDPATGRRLTEPRALWSGTGGRFPEAPHLYKLDGTYYLMLAEGGTEYGHMETIARADSPWGPFEPCPRNPILTHRDLNGGPIQATGHADLVQAHDGSWWAVFLAIRPAWRWHHLGRETFLAPVTWDADGWPVVGDAGTVQLEVQADCLPDHPWPDEPVRDDFDGPTLRPCWNFLRNPRPADWSLTARPGWLRLSGSAVTIDQDDSPAFVGRRQQHFCCRAAALLDFQPNAEGDEAGLTILANSTHHYELAVALRDGRRCVFVRRRIGDLTLMVAAQPLAEGPLELEIRSDRSQYALLCVQGGRRSLLATAATRYVAKEVCGGFTGVYLGLYATGTGRAASAPANFDWFDYEPLPEPTA